MASIPFTTLSRRLCTAGLLAAVGVAASLPAQASEKFVLVTNWFAQAEHGGFYQAQAKGLYAASGLDVTIRMGGPQVNALQIMGAGQADCVIGSSNLQMMQARGNGFPVVTVAAMFQKDPQGLIAHDDVKSFEDMKGRTILIASSAHQGYWPWLKAKYGFTDAQTRPYTFNIQPFVADGKLVQQGYATAETFALQQAGVKHRMFLFADYGYPSYATTISCMDKTVKDRSAALQAFVKATAEGWKSYMSDPAPANTLIKKVNTSMTDPQLAYGLEKIKEYGMVTGGDAASQGIGTMTPERIKQGYDFLVANKLIDPAKVTLESTTDYTFLKNLKVLP